MTFISILETLFIGPLKLVFEIIFQGAYRLIGNPGIAIILLSLLMNVLVLPLYRRADAMQEKARDTEAKLHDGVAHIKKTFSGDERMMILQAYYRQNNYKPTDVLHGSVSLLLEIPFFMAAYQFLSHLEILKGISFGPIKDLGSPDGLLVIGGVAINLLPILMTLINVVSSALYLKGFPLKTKLQLYGMATFFLVFLYTSPAGLVFYWTLNNLFSLCKNIFYKLKNPQKVLKILMSLAGVVVFSLYFFANKLEITKPHIMKYVFLGAGILLQLPLVISLIKSKIKSRTQKELPPPNAKLFIAGALFLTVFIGALIPSNFIADSPQEYIDISNFFHPVWYIVSALSVSAGTFVVWMGVFYWLANPKGKVIFERIVCTMCAAATVNYMFFGTKLGIINPTLTYQSGLFFKLTETLLNVLVVAALTAAVYFIAKKWTNVIKSVLVTALAALVVMSGINFVTINKSINEVKALGAVASDSKKNAPNFNLSTDGKNVVVIMLDRAMGEYVPYILNEKPELKERFEGFTYYSNVVSFGGFTNMGVPAMMGGYEYTPVEMNKRDTEKLADKHNEALKVMPVLFAQNGYNVTVCDAPYAGYRWIPDMSIYDGYSINTYITKGYFSSDEMKDGVKHANLRNFFCFGVMKSLPLFMQPAIYAGGDYNQAATMETVQKTSGASKAIGTRKTFMDSYAVLQNLDTMTNIEKGSSNNFLFLSNDVTHEPMILDAPEYVPQNSVDNTEYDKLNKDRFTVDGKSITVVNSNQMMHYHTNLAALMRLADWFDYMRESGVYDNTKIIIVSDHGRDLDQMGSLVYETGKSHQDVGAYFPLLLVKDFDSTGEIKTDDQFMTNADVPTLAFDKVINNPVNPFTGKVINNSEKTAHDQLIMTYSDWRVEENNGYTYNAATWAAITNDIWDRNDWKFYDEYEVIKEHKLP